MLTQYKLDPYYKSLNLPTKKHNKVDFNGSSKLGIQYGEEQKFFFFTSILREHVWGCRNENFFIEGSPTPSIKWALKDQLNCL